jgi:hypothetical protein
VGLRWWPGIFLGEVLVNAELLVDNTGLPFGSPVGSRPATWPRSSV